MAALIFLSIVLFQPWRSLMCFQPHVLVPQRSVNLLGPLKYSRTT
ncbi:hypothetical protein [Streptomyces sp. NPDC058759]